MTEFCVSLDNIDVAKVLRLLAQRVQSVLNVAASLSEKLSTPQGCTTSSSSSAALRIPCKS
eukprot:CAMPEP_0174321008 /NCGR_PEP_ID=MMETSP0810-20121108/9965_1 /TAXON_ID=73025 ORGANISM="Eutreptiella gymnastica-like, Strain CCMP1594" /NCGR_SAMPLE_ID=MMETSP0810 /ASSEMBLY_ACC=CAM_ASM_000659 /LENGTH=60 /DNA_ID=CAMNT_0015432181 /DNA_START=1169 /DNA_END=1351 /DNA_ORIENTATION=+